MNLGWTIGEEILFKGENEFGKVPRTDTCRAITESGVLGIEKRSLNKIRMALYDQE